MKIFLLLFFIGTCPSAFAYIDPGSGMLLIQGLIAALAGFIAFITKPIKTFKAMWNRLKSSRDA